DDELEGKPRGRVLSYGPAAPTTETWLVAALGSPAPEVAVSVTPTGLQLLDAARTIVIDVATGAVTRR
ncbi:MAG: hypothetical protein HUU35_11695, partial [Armatimonadetes bacterium]|nr:hypothetical protein [Armatimonadota bacterium]